MLTKIVGMIWAILGLLWLIKPEALKKRLKKKMSRTMRRNICGFILALGLLLAISVIKIPSILAKIAGLVGIVIAIRAAFILTSKTSEKILTKLVERPLTFFRIGALFILIIGLVLIYSG